ncbi:hypothetical protein M5689_019937 [Euphorbia peplus]|nr:hypothetical protein M5689_019937 [Euphorbia peplus]
MLMPKKEEISKVEPKGSVMLLNQSQFEEELQETEVVYLLMGKQTSQEEVILKEVKLLVAEFHDLFPKDLPNNFTIDARLSAPN